MITITTTSMRRLARTGVLVSAVGGMILAPAMAAPARSARHAPAAPTPPTAPGAASGAASGKVPGDVPGGAAAQPTRGSVGEPGIAPKLFVRDGVRIHVRRDGAAEPRADRPSAEARRQRTVAALLDTRLDLELDEATARNAFAAMADAAQVEIVPRYASEHVANGLDGDTKIILRLIDVSLADAISIVIDRCRASSPATWQIVDGAIDVGPKSWLARPSARVTRTYDVRALLVEAPYFVPPQPGADPGKLPPEIADIAETPLERWARRQGYAIRSAEGIRKPPELVAAELIDFIVAGVEPEAWRASDAQYERRRARGDAAERDPLSVAGQWASVSYHDGALLVVAPDYVHRAIAGLRR
ncbi:MAG: hypothetical protein U0575_05285 [Phycisphaerales bacterium]